MVAYILAFPDLFLVTNTGCILSMSLKGAYIDKAYHFKCKLQRLVFTSNIMQLEAYSFHFTNWREVKASSDSLN